MARKDVMLPVVLAQAQSLATSFSLPSTTLSYIDNASYQIVVTASGSSGQFYLDGSDDILRLPTDQPVNWTQIMPVGAIAGANDTILIDVNQWPHAFCRLRYVSSVAGAGTANVILTTKQLGG